MMSAPVNSNTAGTFRVIAAPPVSNQFIRVHGYMVVAAGSQTLEWQDGGTPLTGAMWMSTGTPHPIDSTDVGIFDLTPGNALNMVLTAPVQTSGFVCYSIHGN